MGHTSENGYAIRRSAPASAEERQLVLEELNAILASYHFRGSKRYPALLKFIVDAALDNRLSDLKERILGVEVFGRDPGYDTNADPVVRISAGEVRKRIAQYYHENGHPSRIQIELPLGSYAPEFRLHAAEPVAIEPQSQEPQSRDQHPHASERGARTGIAGSLAKAFGLGLILGVSLLSAAGYYYYHRSRAPISKPAALDELWSPMLNATRPVLIVVRTAPPDRIQSESESTDFAEHMHYVSVSIAIALAQLASVLKEHGRSYEVKEASQTTLTDVRSRPVVLVGAMGNDWTMRLTAPLRFHFAFAPDGTESILDSADPQQKSWHFNRLQPFSSVTADYAIVARFRDSITEGPVMIIAGLGPYGTEAAGEFVQSPEYLAQLSKTLPQGWKNKNVELVLRTDVIGYNAGPPVLLAAYAW
jgi:hypothetical protein